MDASTFTDYLEKRYKDQLNYYEETSGQNQKKYKLYQWLLIILSTLTTILAALPSDKFDLKYFIVVSAGLVTVLSSALKTFQYQELWVSYRSTIEQLKPELFYYNFNVGDYGQPGVDKETLFVTRIEGILSKERESWPIYKQLMSSAGNPGQVNDELQKKLEELVREKTRKQKTEQVNETIPAEKENTDTTQISDQIVNTDTEESAQ